MLKISQILRSISLSILFGGSAMIVFAAITLVKAAVAKGIPVTEAATTNVPVFLNYAAIALGSAVVLLASEAMEFAKTPKASKITRARWATSALTIAAAMVVGLWITPMMKELLPNIKTDEAAHQQFDKLHHASQGAYGAMILFALASLVLPAFDKGRESA